ncbi:MAG: S-adenosyl-l-methionine hydroxide adenosyltransferase family protein [Candidatus Thorarchaeota archaeon]
MERIIALITDFGPKGQHYVAAMKAIIMNINPLVKIIDIAHDITPYSIIEASYILKTTYKFFPKGSIFIIVVDPGVGGSREILTLKTKSDYIFIGPNNGIFSNVFDISEISECVSIQNEEYYRQPVSSTFHGRDIMAPIGAYITKYKSFPLSDLGPIFNFNKIVRKKITNKIDFGNRSITSSIQYIDSFGNGTTAIQMVGNKIEDLDLSLKDGMKIILLYNSNKYEGIFTSHFSSVHIDSLLFLVGSTGFLEISINQGSASRKIGFKPGDLITIQV